MTNSNRAITAILDRFEENKAIIITDDKQQLIIEKEKLPSGAQEGSVLYLLAETENTLQLQREQVAKTLLNEILKANKESSPIPIVQTD